MTTSNGRISVNPQIRFGKPCIAGSRIAVADVLELLGEGLTPVEICRDFYTDLVVDDVRACVRFAIDLIASEEICLADSA